MTPRNLISKAIESMESLAYRELSEWHNEFLDSAQEAQVFIVPDQGNLLGFAPEERYQKVGRLFEKTVSIVKLPFAITAVEVQMLPPLRPRVYLAFQQDSGFRTLVSDRCADGQWRVCPAAFSYPFRAGPGDNVSPEWDRYFLPSAIFPSAEDVFTAQGTRADETEAAYATLDIIELLLALSCKNVCVDTVEAPTKLNAARVKRGKRPLFRHHVLRLRGVHSMKTDLGGTHASPAMHVRRGHIRQVRPDHAIWVNETMVGSPKHGVVTKDYDMRGRHNPSTGGA